MAMRSSYSESSASESGSSAICGGGSRTRTVRLIRKPSPAKLGFSIRGGSEHGTGFFVTSIEPGSEAHVQGLLMGDQILRVNNFPVEDATHKEVLQLIQGQNTVTLKVKSVGMIPVKDNPDDELTWRIVEPEQHSSSNIIRTDICEDPNGQRLPSDIRMILKVPPKAKLGCGICKGPEWKPGVFVQFTKENSIARQSGLRPGDQIMQCNNFPFTPDTPFSEAVSILRCSGVLELVVRKGAGLDLFPGESSGYNSSASSVAGDNPWPHHRLSVVAEESSSNSRSERSVDGREQNGIHSSRTEYSNGCTVIHVGGNDAEKNKLAEICMVSQQLETKTTTVLVEVHHSEEDDVSHTQSDSSTDRLTNCSSVSSFTSSASSLSSAISQELERRSKRSNQTEGKAQQPKDKLIKSGLAKEKVHQHEQLMEEFKQAHRKMFSANESEKTCAVPERQEEKEIENKKLKSNDKQHLEKKDKCKDTPDGEKLRPKRQMAPPPPPPLPVKDEIPTVKSNTVTSTKKYPAPPPPPSPPYCPTPDYDTTSLISEAVEDSNSKQPQSNGTVLRNAVGKPKGDGVEMQSLESFKLTNPSVTKPKPPNTYFKKNQREGSNTSDSSNGSASTLPLREPKPMVTIREYPGNRERKSPTKFEFLQNNTLPSTDINYNTQPISSRLQNELTQTLTRANLIAKNDIPSNKVLENGHGGQDVHNGHNKGTSVTILKNQQQQPQKHNAPQQPQPFYLFPNGNNQSNGSSDKKRVKPIGSLLNKNTIEKNKPQIIENSLKNSVTFNFGNMAKEIKNGAPVHPNGILKNGNVSHVQIHPQNGGIDRLNHPKSIKFGGM